MKIHVRCCSPGCASGVPSGSQFCAARHLEIGPLPKDWQKLIASTHGRLQSRGDKETTYVLQLKGEIFRRRVPGICPRILVIAQITLFLMLSYFEAVRQLVILIAILSISEVSWALMV